MFMIKMGLRVWQRLGGKRGTVLLLLFLMHMCELNRSLSSRNRVERGLS